ncbi:hypothetical protein DRQ53_16025, partial [bacterium]
MTGPAILDLNDSNLQLWHRGQAVQSPGYALLNGTQYTFGSAARGAARLRPRDINTRYWWQLNTESLQPALGPARHTADLVHAHLLDIHKQAGSPGEMILAVSGSMQRDQLALLLGIVGQCPFDAVALVNRSVALASGYDCAGTLYHLEIQLHQAVITELAQSEGQLEVRRTLPLPGCGLLQLQERLVEIIAAAFIRQTRFDPRRKAESEQQLYDALPAVLRSLGNTPEANIEVMGYRARINRTELHSAGEMLFKSAPEAMGLLHPQDKIIVDPVAGLLPGLMERLPLAELVGEKALSETLEQHIDRLIQPSQGDQALHFVTSLPCLNHPTTSATDTETTPEPEPEVALPAIEPKAEQIAPTHLLLGTVATGLSPTGTALGDSVELYNTNNHWLLRGAGAIRVNGEEYVPGQA